MIWPLPNTIIGLLVALTTWSKPVPDNHFPAIVFVWRGWLKWYMERHNYTGITFGHVVFVRDYKTPVICHELVHVYQNQIFGPLFFPLYGLFSLVAWLWPGWHYYRDNLFERWAYRWQDFCWRYIRRR